MPRHIGQVVLATIFLYTDRRSVGNVVNNTPATFIFPRHFLIPILNWINLGSQANIFIFFSIRPAAAMNARCCCDTCRLMVVQANFATEAPLAATVHNGPRFASQQQLCSLFFLASTTSLSLENKWVLGISGSKGGWHNTDHLWALGWSLLVMKYLKPMEENMTRPSLILAGSSVLC